MFGTVHKPGSKRMANDTNVFHSRRVASANNKAANVWLTRATERERRQMRDEKALEQH